MNSGPTSERIYDAIKRRLLDRMAGPGERLDPARLGEELFSSVTPVRDALHRLAGEALVESRTSDGFHVPSLDAPALQDLYGWNREVILVTLAAVARAASRPVPQALGQLDSKAGAASFFAMIANASPNIEHARTIASLNDRLSAVRLAEATLFPAAAAELASLADQWHALDAAGLRRAIIAYHRRRQAAAAQVIRLLYRPR